MQQVVYKKEVYRAYVSGNIRYSANAEHASCKLERQNFEQHIEDSAFFGKGHKRVTPKSNNERTTEITLYDPNSPQSLDEIVFQYASLEPVIKKEEVEQTSYTHLQQKSPIETMLLEDAQKTCNAFRENWDKYTNQKKEARLKLNNINEENIDTFLNESVPLMAFDVYEIINTLVTSEGWRESSFPKYKDIYKSVEDEYDLKKRAMYARKLIMLLESKIPATVKFKTTLTLTPVINSKTTGTLDMEQWKQTRIK